MHLHCRNVNDAFRSLVSGIHSGAIKVVPMPSRYGQVLKIPEPVVLTYSKPRERVLFNTLRDCNPFFHLFEALWMLAGREDVEPIAYYTPRIKEFSDNGLKLHGAYGYRWRKFFGWDQLRGIIEELKADPTTRRAVLQMWNGYTLGDFTTAVHGGKDVPCNVCAFFDIEIEETTLTPMLNMTVINRSNDMIFGMLGANVVHFSMLQEYIANCATTQRPIRVGKYNQITNNLHVYTSSWNPEKWMGYYNDITMHDPKVVEYADDIEDRTVNGGVLTCPFQLAVFGQKSFDNEVKQFINNPYRDWKEPFLDAVAKPMCQAFKHHKARQYGLALEAIARVQSEDWQQAGYNWISKRKTNWENKNERSELYSSPIADEASTSADQE